MALFGTNYADETLITSAPNKAPHSSAQSPFREGGDGKTRGIRSKSSSNLLPVSMINDKDERHLGLCTRKVLMLYIPDWFRL